MISIDQLHTKTDDYKVQSKLCIKKVLKYFDCQRDSKLESSSFYSKHQAVLFFLMCLFTVSVDN